MKIFGSNTLSAIFRQPVVAYWELLMDGLAQ